MRSLTLLDGLYNALCFLQLKLECCISDSPPVSPGVGFDSMSSRGSLNQPQQYSSEASDTTEESRIPREILLESGFALLLL